MSIQSNDPKPVSDALPYSLRVTANGSAKTAGILNPGYWGIDVRPQVYTGSFYVYGDYDGKFTVSLQSNLSDHVFASKQIDSHASATKWTQHKFTLNPPESAPNSNNTFSISYDPGQASGPLDFNLISLFPPTFNDRPNGMRIDLMQELQGLSPSFLRFPGGNNLEGDDPPNYWKWNETIGPLTERPGRAGVWGYYNTDGIGLDEYFDWSEDLDVEPILAVWAGFYLLGPAVRENELDAYVQDALNELEYVLGGPDTLYGAMRAANGHPEPRKLRYVEIGNEDYLGGGLESYAGYRLNAFYTAIKEKYPDLNFISSTVYTTLPDKISGDYHTYARPDQLVSQFNFFDGNSTDHQTLIGEFAAVQQNDPSNLDVDFDFPRNPFPFWLGTVSEAIFLLGAENNADAIMGASWAPLFQNLNSYAWAPDLISFAADPGITVRSTSYQMNALMSGSRFTQQRPIMTDDKPGPAYWAAGDNTASGASIFKGAVYNASMPVPFTVRFDSVKQGTPANLTVLTAPEDMSYADVGNNPVKTMTRTIECDGDGYSFELPPLSVAVLETEGDRRGSWGYGGYGGCKNGAVRQSYDWQTWLSSDQAGNGC